MAGYDPNLKPRLRFVEAHPVDMDGTMGFTITDPTGLASSSITVSEAALFLLSKFDGETTLEEARQAFVERFNQPVSRETLAAMVTGLSDTMLLVGDAFDRYYESLVRAYEQAPTRKMMTAADLGLDEDPHELISDLLDSAPPSEPLHGRIGGILAPHLDYARGRVCYGTAYLPLINWPTPGRVVILGTNHYGRSSSVVATCKPFETPLGITRCDCEFVERLEARCGGLRGFEYDHAREHSVELQVMICQHIWGADSFEIVPILCPDPCGLSGFDPYDGNGVNLKLFAEFLGECIADDYRDTLVIAAADLSHIGAHFGDERDLDEEFLSEVEARDRAALALLAASQPDSFVEAVAAQENPTRICSAGCIYVAMTALAGSTVRLLRYDQAVDSEGQAGVTCAAAVFLFE